MATVIDEEQLDIDYISEYVREQKEPQSQAKHYAKDYAKDLLGSASEVISAAKALKFAVLPNKEDVEIKAQPLFKENPVDNLNDNKNDVLETLWPGVQHDFSHSVTVKRNATYYLFLGFAGGAVLSLILAWSFNAIGSIMSNWSKTPSNLAQAKVSNSPVVASDAANNSGVRVPVVPTYEVKEGDTLAAIALANYKHVSPRLLDAICKANNLTDADVLNLGQKLTLPEYRY